MVKKLIITNAMLLALQGIIVAQPATSLKYGNNKYNNGKSSAIVIVTEQEIKNDIEDLKKLEATSAEAKSKALDIHSKILKLEEPTKTYYLRIIEGIVPGTTTTTTSKTTSLTKPVTASETVELGREAWQGY